MSVRSLKAICAPLKLALSKGLPSENRPSIRPDLWPRRSQSPSGQRVAGARCRMVLDGGDNLHRSPTDFLRANSTANAPPTTACDRSASVFVESYVCHLSSDRSSGASPTSEIQCLSGHGRTDLASDQGERERRHLWLAAVEESAASADSSSLRGNRVYSCLPTPTSWLPQWSISVDWSSIVPVRSCSGGAIRSTFFPTPSS